MEDEQLNIFDSKGRLTGTASRADAHKKGLWHETFHCWFIEVKEHKIFIHFQLRSPDKKRFSKYAGYNSRRTPDSRRGR